MGVEEATGKPKRQAKVPKFIKGFDFVAPGIWHRTPQKRESCFFLDSPSSSTSSFTSFDFDFNSPDLILLLSWTGALPSHVAKYTNAYQRLYPSSPVMIITTTLKDLIVSTSAEKQARLQPAIDLIEAPQSNRSILLHAFSEGGSNKAVEFAEAYHSRTGQKFPCHAICFDSTPGLPRYWNTAAAFRKSLPNEAITRFIGCLVGFIVLALFWCLYGIFKGADNNIITKTRNRLDDERYWDLRAPRCYLYSRADELIYWKDIEDHGIAAARNGTPVVLVRFEESPHCNHVKEDAGGYWEAVRATWEMRDVEIGLAM